MQQKEVLDVNDDEMGVECVAAECMASEGACACGRDVKCGVLACGGFHMDGSACTEACCRDAYMME